MSNKKKLLKKKVNENGFYYSVAINSVAPPEQYASKVPQGASYFEGIVCDGEFSRNGYMIRPKALMNAFAEYMRNPIILLQHDPDQPIGLCLDAKLVSPDGKGGVWVCGYVYDDLTENRFERGLLRALSTGHFTDAVEFENSRTGQILTQDEYRNLPYEERENEEWMLAVTKLDWAEFSVVTIGSNKKALITRKNAIDAFMQFGKLSQLSINSLLDMKVQTNEAEEVKAPEVQEEVKEPAKVEQEEAEKVAPEKEGETPEAEAKAEEAKAEEEAPKPNKVLVKPEDRAKMLAASKELNKLLESTTTEEEVAKEVAIKVAVNFPTEMSDLLVNIAKHITAQDKEINSLKALVDKIPNTKVLTNQLKLQDNEAPKREDGLGIKALLKNMVRN